MKKNSTDQLKVEGKMSEKDSGIVVKLQALALIIASLCFGSAAVIAALALVI